MPQANLKVGKILNEPNAFNSKGNLKIRGN